MFVCLKSPFVLMEKIMYRHSAHEDTITISPVLKSVLALEELASGVVSLADSTGVQRGLRT